MSVDAGEQLLHSICDDSKADFTTTKSIERILSTRSTVVINLKDISVVGEACNPAGLHNLGFCVPAPR